MFTGLELMACPNLAVSAEVMQHVVHVESKANPYAIGIVGGRLIRQPENFDEALATVHMLNAANYDYSLGLAQVNRANLGKYGLDSYQKAFSPCANLTAGAQILAACYSSSGGDWGKAFSCYYSGNFVSGFRDGYVRKIYESINHNRKSHIDSGHSFSTAEQASPQTSGPDAKGTTAIGPGSGAYRIAMRSIALDSAPIRRPASGPASASSPEEAAPTQSFGSTPRSPRDASAGALEAGGEVTLQPPLPATHAAFVPQVTGPNDPHSANTAALTAQNMARSSQVGSELDRADLREDHGDAAFVF